MKELEFHFHAGVEFSAPVNGHTFALHCLPMEDDAQKLQSYAVRIDPAAEYGLHRDGFGSWLVCGSCREPHTAFGYDSHGIVQVNGHPQAEPVNPVLKQFTELTAMTEELEALWQSLPLEGKSPQEQAELLNKAAAGALHYVPGITGLSTTAGQALVLGALLLAARKKTVVGDYHHPQFLTVTGWIIFAVMLCLAVETASKLLPKLLG